MRRYHHFLTALPGLPALGEPPPLALRAVHERAAESPRLAAVVAAALLEADLRVRQAALAGEVVERAGVVLTPEQLGGEAPLPAVLCVDDAPGGPRDPADALWAVYFGWVAGEGRRLGCPFLGAWAGFEVALRNALAARRAARLALPPEEHLVAEELGAPGAEVDAVAGAWEAAGDALAAERALDEGRWRFGEARGGWFSFRVDEAAAYARALVLLHRWHALGRPAGEAAEPAPP